MKIKNVLNISCAFLAILLLTSCFTGIEGTKKIKLSREDKRHTAPTAEELFMHEIKGTDYSSWRPGRLFAVTDARASLLIDPERIVSGNEGLQKGDTLMYISSGFRIAPDGVKGLSLTFRRGEDTFTYAGSPADKNINSASIPGLVDMSMIEQVRKLMLGKTLWTRSGLWLDEDGMRKAGRRFERVDVTDVGVGDMVFPIRVDFTDSKGEGYHFLMNFGDSGKDSRSFSTLFSLTDPRAGYPGIPDKIWDNIQRGIVEIGMTKEECRLSKGNPSEVTSGHDYSRSLLLWSYPDAMVLYFVDGILAGINEFGN